MLKRFSKSFCSICTYTENAETRNCNHGPRKMKFLLSAAIVCVSWTLAIQGELVILKGNDYLKVTDFRVMGKEVRVTLPSGGSMTLPLLRVERIIDDEILPEPEIVPEPDPPLQLSWDPSHEIPPTPYGAMIHSAARRHGLNPEIIASMMRHESGFDTLALSPSGARGLMQLMPATAERFGVSQQDLHDPQHNLEAALRYVSYLANRYDSDLKLVLAAFNSGEGTVARFNGVPPYRETREYVRRIFSDLGVEQGDETAE